MSWSSQGRGGNTQQEQTTLSETIDGVLEEIFSKSEPKLWDRHLLEILNQYDDKDNRNLIYVYRKTISRLNDRLSRKEDGSTMRMILGKMLKSYKRRLDEAQENSTSTPESSDDEDADEPIDEDFDTTPSTPQCFDAEVIEQPVISSKLAGLHGKLLELRTIAVDANGKKPPVEGKLPKVDDTITSVETTKTSKIIKAAQVTS